jgi:hypothetical protein
MAQSPPNSGVKPTSLIDTAQRRRNDLDDCQEVRFCSDQLSRAVDEIVLIALSRSSSVEMAWIIAKRSESAPVNADSPRNNGSSIRKFIDGVVKVAT